MSSELIQNFMRNNHTTVIKSRMATLAAKAATGRRLCPYSLHPQMAQDWEQCQDRHSRRTGQPSGAWEEMDLKLYQGDQNLGPCPVKNGVLSNRKKKTFKCDGLWRRFSS